MANQEKSAFKFNGYYIRKFVFDGAKTVSDQDSLDLDIVPSGIDRGAEFELTLKVSITCPQSNFSILTEIVGLFTFKNRQETVIPDYFLINAPAILFPYLRAYISSFTSLSGTNTITIPTMNLTNLKGELIDNITTEARDN